MLSAKLLEAASRKEKGESLEVIVELPRPSAQAAQQVGAARGERIANRQKDFTELSEEVRIAIEKLGGEVLGSVWLNATLKARIPVGELENLDAIQHVRAIDLPSPLRRDS